MLMKKLAGGAALCVLAFTATGAFAQEITGGIAGTITENGKPLVGADVKVTNPANGQSFSTTSGPDGFYTVRNVQPGGPYTVTVTAPDKQTASDTVDQVPIGAPVQLDMPIGATASEVTVTASPLVRNLTVATGPRTVITSRDIQELPSFARDLHDLVRLNPFVTIDEANSNSLIIAGANNHFNTIYLDGVRQSDDFGLNNNGYPTQRTPFSLGIVQSLNLEVAPYDVQYGDFEGGIINVVTKSGTNQFHGSVQYEYDSSSESGKFIGPDAIYAGVEGLKPAERPAAPGHHRVQGRGFRGHHRWPAVAGPHVLLLRLRQVPGRRAARRSYRRTSPAPIQSPAFCSPTSPTSRTSSKPRPPAATTTTR